MNLLNRLRSFVLLGLVRPTAIAGDSVITSVDVRSWELYLNSALPFWGYSSRIFWISPKELREFLRERRRGSDAMIPTSSDKLTDSDKPTIVVGSDETPAGSKSEDRKGDPIESPRKGTSQIEISEEKREAEEEIGERDPRGPLTSTFTTSSIPSPQDPS